ncbi:hypothetical protein A3C96_00625 [Candidatus Uhrbacteria bacterium RIFCSPHIGHO2_02_FULL_60_10]|uniref:Type II secretion system protein GspG C-terminal domain-containing protein n=1 Tax=Candidatus Uhrbacteria bacterium RIFCSPHIGHO2_02_FULL_60_10 TaxID=1802392 RepID=A0A1F7UBE6_9BACT|nr:MAG: hypothetical protein A3C96_00625 [Candidatus Uhrbacteria bacterium RIFCSPHIGHO2_02_FULL_60_10]
MTNNKKGFTLIELLVVIAIIGLLSTLAVVALNSARQKSRDSKRVADIKQIQTALELYFADAQAYPVGTNLVLGGASANKLCATTGLNNTCTGTTYMGLVPKAPTPADGAACNGTNNDYFYTVVSGNSDYGLTFCTGTAVGELTVGRQCATSAGVSTKATCP